MSKIKGRPPKGIRVGRPRIPFDHNKYRKRPPRILPYEDVKNFIFNLGVKSEIMLLRYKRKHKPQLSKMVYRSLNLAKWYPDQFPGYEEFFKNSPPKYLSYEQAKKIVNDNNIIGVEPYREFCKIYNKNKKVGKLFPRYHKYEEYVKGCNKDWDLFFNVQKPNYLPFEEARAIIHQYNLKTQEQWKAFVDSDNFPTNIPKHPETVYKNQYVSLQNWLGKGLLDQLQAKDEYSGIWTILHLAGDPLNMFLWKHFPTGYSTAKQWCDENDYTIIRMYKHEFEYEDKVNAIIRHNSISFIHNEFITTHYDQLRYQLDMVLLIHYLN